MKNFEFWNPVKILFGKDQLKQLSKQIAPEKRILLLYGGGSIKKNGVYQQIVENLNGYTVVEFGGIEPNPHYETAMKAVELIKKEKLDFILAAGGGSVIDAAKFIAAATLFEDGDPWTILSQNKAVKKALPVGVVLTLPATGSEMNSGGVITRAETQDKFAFGSKVTFPQFSVLLPDAAGTLPPKQVANGIVDAFIHVIEQYLNYPANAPIQDRFAESILQTLIEVAPVVYKNPADYDAMSTLMWSATMALNGLIGTGVPSDWSIHMIGHELTAFHGIDHGRTLAIVLPGLWKVLREEKREKLLQYGQRVWNITGGNEDERIHKIIETTENFFHSLDVPTKLKDYDVDSATIDRIVNRFTERKWMAIGDRQLVTPDVVRKVLETQLV
jgi:NADP-dependent alcohol dehydrogenase